MENSDRAMFAFLVLAVVGVSSAAYMMGRGYFHSAQEHHYEEVSDLADQYPSIAPAIKCRLGDGELMMWEVHEIREMAEGRKKAKWVEKILGEEK